MRSPCRRAALERPVMFCICFATARFPLCPQSRRRGESSPRGQLSLQLVPPLRWGSPSCLQAALPRLRHRRAEGSSNQSERHV